MNKRRVAGVVIGFMGLLPLACLCFGTGFGGCDPPHHGAFLQEGPCEYVEIPRGTAAYPSQDIPGIASSQPTIVFWDPSRNLGGIFMENTVGDRVPIQVSSSGELWQITPSEPLLLGQHCLILPNILLPRRQAPQWCFVVL